MTLKFSLKDLLLLTAVISVACAALANAGIWWHSIVVSLTLAGWTGLTIWGVMNLGSRRAFTIGWLLMAIGYLGLVFGPWTGSQLGPNLITTRGLTQLELTTRGNNPSPLVLQSYSPQVDFSGDLSLLISGTTLYPGGYSPPNARIWNSTGSVAGNGLYTIYDHNAGTTISTFQSTGHWLLASIFGFGGGHLAAFLFASRRKVAKN
jgi:hypothetical protein